MTNLVVGVIGAALFGTSLGISWSVFHRIGCPRCSSPVPLKRLLIGSSSEKWNCDTCHASMRFNPALRRSRRILRNSLVWGFLWVELIGRLVRLFQGGSFEGNFLPLPAWGYYMLLAAIVGIGLIPDAVHLVPSEQEPSRHKSLPTQ